MHPGIAGTNGNSGLVTFLPVQCIHVTVPTPDFIFPLSTFPLTRVYLIEYMALPVLIGNEHKVLSIELGVQDFHPITRI